MSRKPARKRVFTRLKRKKKPNYGYNRKKKTLKKIAVSSVLTLFSAGFLGLLFIYNYFHQSLASALSPSSFSITESKYPAILYVVVEDIEQKPHTMSSMQLKILDKENKKVLSYQIPLNIKIDVPGKYGEEEINKIFALGALENDSEEIKGGINLLKSTVFNLFGFKVDKYVLIDRSLEDNFSSFWSNGDLFGILNKATISRLGTHMSTDISLKEFYNIKEFVNSLPSDRIFLNEFTSAMIENPSLIDDDLRDLTYDSYLSQEKKSIAVLNGSSKPGLANFGSRVISNYGGRVVAANNAQNSYEKSILIADSGESQTVAFLSNVFGISQIITKEEAKDKINENEVERSDIIVIFGFDRQEVLY